MMKYGEKLEDCFVLICQNYNTSSVLYAEWVTVYTKVEFLIKSVGVHWNLEIEKLIEPDECGSVGWVSTHAPRGHRFNPQ